MEIPRELYDAIRRQSDAMSVALDERDTPTSEHCGRVATLSLELGKACGLSSVELHSLRIAATFHDVGKIGIPDSVLKKETPFDEHDWAIMKSHSAKSQRIILSANLEDGEAIGLAVRHHHEHYNGRGYPDGLAGEAIPILARIVAIADAYDAMAQLRCYRPARPHAQIMEILHHEQGVRHDPFLYTKFTKIIRDGKFRAAG